MEGEKRSIEVLFTPADFEKLRERDLSGTVCVVFDVLRATSSMVTALANGAEAIRPFKEIDEALRSKAEDPNVLLAGERDGLRIRSNLTGSIDFNLGNSPREFMAEVVRGRRIVMSTTNGTRALRACTGAKQTLVGSFLNLVATANSAVSATNLLIVCSGTFEEAAYEDTLAAGALCDLVWPRFEKGHVTDGTLMGRLLWLNAKANLLGSLSESRNGRRLLARPDLKDDVAFCAELNKFASRVEMQADGWVRATT